jgi:glycosyltransferase involved in cell wall biosynthesis
VVPTRNGEAVLATPLGALADRLAEGDELVVVENGSTDGTTPLLESVAQSWAHPVTLVVLHSEPGLGNALRAGVLASRGERVLLTADDLPFGFSDLDGFAALPPEAVLAVGSKAHPASAVDRSWRREAQSEVFRWLRRALLHSAVGDSQGTIWVDGVWARAFAAVSRETGLMWTVEMVLAAEEQGLDVWEVPVTLSEAHDTRASRFRLRDARIAVREISSLAVRRDDYSGQEWVSPGRALSMSGTEPA